MKTNELMELYTGATGDIVAVYQHGNCVYQEWATNVKTNPPKFGDIKCFYVRGKRFCIELW